MLEWKLENNKYYCYKDGVLLKGWIQDENNKWYHLNDKDGSLDTGWFETATDGGKWFYGYPEKTEKDSATHYTGEMATGWIELNDNWYYLLTEKTEYNSDTHYTGECVVSATITIDNKSYTFDSKGVMQENSTTSDSLISDDLVEFIKGWEDFFSNAYYDGYGTTDTYLTIGYGTTKASNESAFPNGASSTCTVEQATEWLKEEINKVATIIKASLGNTVLSQNAFDCLCDIGYNAGTDDLIGGNTWNAIISGDADSITTHLMSWNKADDIYSDGLNKRCLARVKMCLTGVYDTTH